MIIPIRCFTCGSILASKYNIYKTKLETERTKQNEDATVVLDTQKIQDMLDTKQNVPKTPECIVLDDMGIKRYCCRRHFIAQVDIFHHL